MKRGPHHKEKKSRSAPGLLNTVRGVFLGISIPFSKEQDLENRGKKQNITLADCLMSTLAMFSQELLLRVFVSLCLIIFITQITERKI